MEKRKGMWEEDSVEEERRGKRNKMKEEGRES